jgi:hypothetical protein
VSAFGRFMKYSLLCFLIEISVLDFFATKVRMEQVCPSYRHQYDEDFGLESYQRTIEDLNG